MGQYWRTHRSFRDAVYLSLSFGTIGWITGATVPGHFNGANPFGGILLFTVLLGTIGWFVGYVIGATVEQSIKYYQGPEPPDAAPEPTA
jgi:hypothetical protein